MINSVNNTAKNFKEQTKCVFETALYFPTRYGCKCVLSIAVVIIAIVTSIIFSFIEYGIFYNTQIPVSELVQDLQFAPQIL